VVSDRPDPAQSRVTDKREKRSKKDASVVLESVIAFVLIHCIQTNSKEAL
jgi:hypothetical protein